MKYPESVVYRMYCKSVGGSNDSTPGARNMSYEVIGSQKANLPFAYCTELAHGAPPPHVDGHRHA